MNLEKEKIAVVFDKEFKNKILFQYGMILLKTFNDRQHYPDIYIVNNGVYVDLMGDNNVFVDHQPTRHRKMFFYKKSAGDIFSYSNIMAYTDASAFLNYFANPQK